MKDNIECPKCKGTVEILNLDQWQCNDCGKCYSTSEIRKASKEANGTGTLNDPPWSGIGWFLLFSGIIVIGFQCVWWLKTGDWYSMPLSRLIVIHNPTAWVGVNLIIKMILWLPVSATLWVVGIFLIELNTK